MAMCFILPLILVQISEKLVSMEGHLLSVFSIFIKQRQIISEKLISMEVYFFLLCFFIHLFHHFRKTSQYGSPFMCASVLLLWSDFRKTSQYGSFSHQKEIPQRQHHISEKLVSMEVGNHRFLGIQQEQLNFRKTSQYGSQIALIHFLFTPYTKFQKNQLVWKSSFIFI